MSAGSKSSSSQASDQTQLNGAVTSKPAKGAVKGKKEEARPVDLSLLHLKVGMVRKAERHPDADTLYVEEIDCGEEKPRTVGLLTTALFAAVWLATCALANDDAHLSC